MKYEKYDMLNFYGAVAMSGSRICDYKMWFIPNPVHKLTLPSTRHLIRELLTITSGPRIFAVNGIPTDIDKQLRYYLHD